MGRGSKNKIVFSITCWNYLVYLTRYYIMHFILLSTVRYRCIVFIPSGEFPEREEAFYHPAYMGNCPTLVTSVIPIYLVHEFHFLFLLFLTPPPPPLPLLLKPNSNERNGLTQCVWSVCRWLNGGWFLLGFDATLEAGCGFWEHLHNLREVKDLKDCS